jgi:hypothetical protein
LTVLKHFQLLNFESKASAFEFYNTLARLTDNTGLYKPKVCELNSPLSRVVTTLHRIDTVPLRSWFVSTDIWRCSSGQWEDTILGELWQLRQGNVPCCVPPAPILVWISAKAGKVNHRSESTSKFILDAYIADRL